MFIIGDAVQTERYKGEGVEGGFLQFSATVKSFSGDGRAVVEDAGGKIWTVECISLWACTENESQSQHSGD